MSFTKESKSIALHFGDASASFIKKVLEEKIANPKDQEELAICQELRTDLMSQVKFAFGPAIWDSL